MRYRIELEGFPTEEIEADHQEKAWDAYKAKHLRPTSGPIRPSTPPLITVVDNPEG